jgi:hypothetical protein
MVMSLVKSAALNRQKIKITNKRIEENCSCVKLFVIKKLHYHLVIKKWQLFGDSLT